MQAIIIISIFSMVMAIMASVISTGTSNSQLLTDDRITETKAYFDSISKVITGEITKEYMQANPISATTVADYIRGMPELAQLSSGRYADPALDPWGKLISGFMYDEYQSLVNDGRNVVLVPVTGFVMVSAGPNGILETSVAKPSKFSGIYGIAPVNDDIVYTFDNRQAQEQNLAAIDANLKQIGTAALKELQNRLTAYRQSKLAQYQVSISIGLDPDIAVVNMVSDTTAPSFISLTDPANRVQLGVGDAFTRLERKIGKANLIVSASAPKTLAAPLEIKVFNGATPTPWGKPSSGLRYQISVFAIDQ